MNNMRYTADERIEWYIELGPEAAYYESDLFREHGPSYISVCGEVNFYQLHQGKGSRRSGPSTICSDGYIMYTNDQGDLHRTNGPAVIEDNHKVYYINNQRLTADEFFLKYGVV